MLEAATTGSKLYPTLKTNHDFEVCKIGDGEVFAVRALQGHSVKPFGVPSHFNMRVISENWKRLIFHTGSSKKYRNIAENGLRGEGMSSRAGRQACFFLAFGAA